MDPNELVAAIKTMAGVVTSMANDKDKTDDAGGILPLHQSRFLNAATLLANRAAELLEQAEAGDIPDLFKKVEAEYADLGICHSQFFQGYGVSFSPFTDCVTGIGNSFEDAYNDALEQMYFSGETVGKKVEAYLVSEVGMTEEVIKEISSANETVDGNLKAEYRSEHPEVSDEDELEEKFSEWVSDTEINLYYHVGIRWRLV